MWNTFLTVITVCLTIQWTVCKPVDKRGPPPPQPVEGGSQEEENVGTGLEYDRYLRQVVEMLESDNEFRKKLEQANVSDIKSGAIASHLELVNNSIRTKLDEIKRMEVQRLQELARIKMRSMSGTEVLYSIAMHGGVNRFEIPGHLDLTNPHSFEMKDLENLIRKTSHDLETLDNMRRKDFKEYEMEKEYEYQQKLKESPEEERKRIQAEHEELRRKHNAHEKVNHPGSKDQFEEVWEKDDKLDQEFDPKTFFMMHDLNGDGMWDIQEVEAVLQRELDKMYDTRKTPEEDDPMERFEEMNRMREHVFGEIDRDKDFMITLQEFLIYTGKHGENKNFTEDDGWDAIGEQPAFNDEEYQNFVQQHHAQPGVVNIPPENGNLKFTPEEQLRQQQMQHQGVPQGFQQGVPQQGFQQGIPQQGFQQGLPQQGFQQGVPQQGFQQGLPQQGFQQGVPQQGFQQQGVQQNLQQQQQINQQQNQQFQQQQLHQQQLNQQQFNQQPPNQQQFSQQQNQQFVPQQPNSVNVQDTGFVQQQAAANQINIGQQAQGQQGQSQPSGGEGQPIVH